MAARSTMALAMPSTLVLLALLRAAAEPPVPAAQSALAGPAIRERERPSIVRHNIFGELQRPEETPEEAAVRELGLPPGAAADVERVFLRRVRWIDQWVSSNAGLLVRLKRASDAMPLGERVTLVLEALRSAEPLTHAPSLWDQVREVLDTPSGEEFDRMMLEYWDAVAADGRPRAPGLVERFAIISKERLAILGREIERSLETLGDQGGLAVTALTGGMDLSDAQRAQLAIMVSDYDRTADVPPSQDQKRALVLKVMSILGPEQREQVLALIGGG